MASPPASDTRPLQRLADACIAKEWSKAIKLLSSLLSDTPNSVPLLCNRAFCHVKLELHKHAVKDCDKALSLDPMAFRAYVYKGHALAGLGRHQDAGQTWRQGYEAVVTHCGCIELLQELHTLVMNSQGEISENNVFGTTNLELSNCTPDLELSASPLRTKLEFSTCTTDLEISSRLQKTSLEISNSPISTMISWSPPKTPPKTSMQVEELSKISKRKDNHKVSQPKRGAHLISLDLRLSRGISQVNNGKYEEAVTTFDQVLKDNPDSVEALLGRGTALAFQRNLEAAIADFSQAIQVNPQTGEAWKRRGQAKAALGVTAEAIADLTKALEFESTSSDILYERGVIFFKSKNYESAVKDLQGCEALDNSNKFAQSYLGLALLSIGRSKEAIEAHNRAINLDPTFKEGWTQLAQSYHELGNSVEAMQCLQKALSIDERYVNAYRLLGMLLHGLGDHRDAVKEVSTALEFDPSNVECKYLRASCRHALGDFADAVKDYDSVLEARVDTTEKCTLQYLAYYQREIASYTASKVTAAFSLFDIDGDFDPVWKEAWCKRLRPTVAIAFLCSQPSVKMSLRNGRLRPQDMVMTKPRKILLEVADRLGSRIQYNCSGFLKNRRQHRMAGLAAIEIAQKVLNTWRAMKESWVLPDDRLAAKIGKRARKRENTGVISHNRGGVCSSSGSSVAPCCHEENSSSSQFTLKWQNVYSIAVKWRQASEPCDPVVWVNKLSEKEFNAGFGSHTPILLGQAHVVRYYSNFPRAFSILRKLMLEQKSVHNADNQLVDLSSDYQLQAINAAKSCSELHNVVGDDFWVVTPCCSTSFEGKILDGTRLTLQKKETGFDFSIRTPGTPSRWADYDMEMSAAWEALCEAYCWDSCGSTDVQQLEKVRDSILRLSFYWYNFMPLARGTAAVGYTVLLGLFLATGMEISASIPQGFQVDWEAILSPDLNSFMQAVCPWLYPSVRTNVTWQNLPDIASTFQSAGAVIAGLSIYD